MSNFNKSQLKDFQRATVDYVFGRLFDKESPASRFLVADEVGLGKTLIARGVIEKFYERFKALGKQQLKVIYICSNQSVASQNINRLNVEKAQGAAPQPITRINEIAIKQLDQEQDRFLQLIALSPNTSFNVTSGGGTGRERAIIFHMLCSHEHIRVYSRKLKKLFQLDVGDKNWGDLTEKRSWIKRDLREDITAEFNQVLTAESEIYASLVRFCEDKYDSNEQPLHRRLIGELRRLLASVCVQYLNADLIILDEFQRFKNIIDQEGESEVKLITKSLFSNPHIKALLLSATPYKMYTVQSEEEEGESHFEEFKFIIRFLLNNEGKYTDFIRAWESYSQSLLHLKSEQWEFIKKHKQTVESHLRKFIARTERITVSDDHNTLLRSSEASILWISPSDIKNFTSADTIAAKLGEFYENIHSPVEYCKSSPYPFSFMEGYQLQRVAQKAIQEKNGEFLNTLKANKSAFLPKEAMNTYSDIEIPSAKLKYLLDDTLYNGGTDLLWIPPALPYYKFEGPFRDKEAFSKTLVFSSWVMVPKMIAGLASYECERLTIGNPASISKAEEKSTREYFKIGKDRHPKPRLNFKIEEGVTYSTLPQYALLYPCMTLTALWLPYANLGTVRSLAEKVNELAQIIKPLIDDVRGSELITEPGKVGDDRWALVLMLLLDKKHQTETIQDLAAKRKSLNWDWLNNSTKGHVDEAEEESSSAKKYYDKVADILFSDLHNKDFMSELKELRLGQIPEDVVEQLAYLTLASPAITAYRLLSSYAHDVTDVAMAFFGAFRVADSYRKFFNTPENIAVVDKVSHTGSYWERVLRYLACGNFQSLVDEYASILIDHNGLWDTEPSAKLNSLIGLLADNTGLRTVWVNGHNFESFTNPKEPASHLRCHFGVALNQSLSNDKDVMRNDKVRDAFNSPFRPFILSTTSIGQEGLDFHLYCRKLLHWNLPANPVDFEQREGRINRFKNLAIRQNLAKKYRLLLELTSADKVWDWLFDIAAIMEKGEKSDLVPYWHLEPEHVFIERQVPAIPYSKEVKKLKNLLKTISIYRVALGQPRQEELVNHIVKDFTEDEIKRLQTDLLINLSPFSYNLANKDD
jgi:hypothetical protein